MTAIAGSNLFELDNATLDIGKSCTVTVTTTTIEDGNLTNSIGISGISTKENVSNPFPAEATITGRAALFPQKSFDREEIAGGVPSTMTITIRNRQRTTALGTLNNVDLTDNFPTGLI
ncbi:MAG: hypothetical protein HC806_03610, partial [Anaerolineae bacterium]|nr:hypothetical protein [Anaerolineae bacterium]